MSRLSIIEKLNLFEVFYVTIKSGGSLVASSKLNMSCSEIDATLKDLENELGVSLYIKTDETYGLTMAGDYLINKLDYILGLID